MPTLSGLYFLRIKITEITVVIVQYWLNAQVNFSGSKSLLEHIKPHVVEAFNGVTSCQKCKSDFSSVQEYFAHLPTHAADVKFVCPKCEQVQPNDRVLQYHVKDCTREEGKDCVRTPSEI